MSKKITMAEYEGDTRQWSHIDYWDARDEELVPYQTLYEALEAYCTLLSEPVSPGEHLEIVGYELDPNRNDPSHDLDENAIRKVVTVTIHDLHEWLSQHWPDALE